MLSDLKHSTKPGGRFVLAEGLVLLDWPGEATAVVYNTSTTSTHLVTAWAGQLLREIAEHGDCAGVDEDDATGQTRPAGSPAAVDPSSTADTPPGTSPESMEALHAQTLEGLMRAGLLRQLP